MLAVSFIPFRFVIFREIVGRTLSFAMRLSIGDGNWQYDFCQEMVIGYSVTVYVFYISLNVSERNLGFARRVIIDRELYSPPCLHPPPEIKISRLNAVKV